MPPSKSSIIPFPKNDSKPDDQADEKNPRVDAEGFIDIQGAAAFLGWRTTAGIYKLNNKIPHYKIGNRCRYRLSDLQKFMDQQRIDPTDGGGK
jgi:hypothetical protein